MEERSATAETAVPRGERQRAVEEVRLLAAEIVGRDGAVAELLTRLADAVERNQPEDVRAYAGAIPPRTVADDLAQRHRSIWSFAELARSALVLLPIAITWYGLAAASATYAELVTKRPELVTQPFLLLWQRGFDGMGGTISFSLLAAIDGTLISIIIALSLAIHYKADVHDPRALAQTLLRESQVRGLLARCLALSPSAQSLDPDLEALGIAAPGIADAVIALRAYAGQLPELLVALEGLAQRSVSIQESLRDQVATAGAREAAFTTALERIVRDASSQTRGASSLAADTATAAAAEQAQILGEMRSIVAGLEEAKNAQRTVLGSVGLQTDAMNYMAKALVLASERVQVASQALGDAAVPPVLFRPLFRRRRQLAAPAAIGFVVLAVVLSIVALAGGAPPAPVR